MLLFDLVASNWCLKRDWLKNSPFWGYFAAQISAKENPATRYGVGSYARTEGTGLELAIPRQTSKHFSEGTAKDNVFQFELIFIGRPLLILNKLVGVVVIVWF
jgi:hypothetical protein